MAEAKDALTRRKAGKGVNEQDLGFDVILINSMTAKFNMHSKLAFFKCEDIELPVDWTRAAEVSKWVSGSSDDGSVNDLELLAESYTGISLRCESSTTEQDSSGLMLRCMTFCNLRFSCSRRSDVVVSTSDIR